MKEGVLLPHSAEMDRALVRDFKELCEIAKDDAQGISGFLWKFPSEGSNAADLSSLGFDQDDAEAFAYPRKCKYCRSSWVSGWQEEEEHWEECEAVSHGASHLQGPQDVSTSADASKLGVPRRVWCEIDSSLSRFQWRTDREAGQQHDTSTLEFQEISDVALLDRPPGAFQVTAGSRRIVFQHREEKGDDCTDEYMDAARWCEYLKLFSRFAQQPESSAKSQQEQQLSEGATGEVSETMAQILRAIVTDDAETVAHLVCESGEASYSFVDTNGSSLLLIAFKLGAGKAIIQCLLDAGVDCNTANQDGESPLLLVAASGETELLQMLLQCNRLDVNQRCASGATAFHAAANAGEVSILRELLDAGADPAVMDANGWTALHYAAACPSGVDAVNYLCELIGDMIDHQCSEGNTALHIAAGYGCVENAHALLATAANPHLVNYEGKTAYHLALKNAQIRCAVVINDYMENSPDLYQRPARASHEQPAPSYAISKYNAISPATPAASGPSIDQQWMGLESEDGLPYYYNRITGESTWHLPQVKPSREAWMGEPTGETLSLCMIPMVSQLVALDDPTAASKMDERRKKAREKRRHRGSRRRTASGHSLDAELVHVAPSSTDDYHSKSVTL